MQLVLEALRVRSLMRCCFDPRATRLDGCVRPDDADADADAADNGVRSRAKLFLCA
jgi:hypothetical protein